MEVSRRIEILILGFNEARIQKIYIKELQKDGNR